MSTLRTFFSLLCLFVFLPVCSAQEGDRISETKIREAIEKAVAYLRTTQDETGAWLMSRSGNALSEQNRNTDRRGSALASVGPTAVILTGLFDVGLDPADPMMEKGMAFLSHAAQEDGGIYTRDGFFQNYETCVALMCFAKANKVSLAKANGSEKKANRNEKGPYDKLLQKSRQFLLDNQFTEHKGVQAEQMEYGGMGYGGDIRPDLSNTQFFLDALIEAGTPADDPAIQKALIFVSRCQNLESEHNTQSWTAAGADGGFVYTTQSSSAGETSSGGLRSYGSMTYAGFKSMIYAGLTKEDERIKAALDWITKNYSVTENPGMEQVGVYYYYQTMAKTLDVLKLEEIEDASGKKHQWKNELAKELLSRQHADGFWVNEISAQYMENNPNLVTGFVLLVLADCLNSSSTP